MPTNAAKLEQMFDRTWRPGHPFRPRLSSLRRRGMLLILGLLLAIIVAYGYLTDSARVRLMCEAYLSQLTGGRVTVKHATLSIFEGLRLDGVSVLVDDSGSPDSRIFSAQSFLLKYNPESILSGKLEATQIFAIEPHVRLCEDLDQKVGRRWNYSRMLFNMPKGKGGPGGGGMGKLPVISLRNGIIDYSQIQNGRVASFGSMALDGGLIPGDLPGSYIFRLQSRGEESEALGPIISGLLVLNTGETRSGKLENFKFSNDIKGMLPDPVRQWWDDHELAGQVDITNMEWVPGHNGSRTRFRVETKLDNVNLSVPPSEWMSRVESDRLAAVHGAFELMRAAGLNGEVGGAGLKMPPVSLDVPPPPEVIGARPAAAISPGEAEVAHLSLGFVDWLRGLSEPAPIRLGQVTGQLIFNYDGGHGGIEVRNLQGGVELNSFTINGHIDGYSPNAAADITINGTKIYIPHDPRYVNSLPRPVHEFWEHLHPEGSCTLMVHLNRETPDAKPVVDGKVHIVDGHILSDRFPYPLRKMTGDITFGPDRINGGERLDIKDLKGFGAEGSVNANNPVVINGFVAPLTLDGECSIEVRADDITLEPVLDAAFPPDVREIVRLFDTGGTRGFPEGHGGFIARVRRPPGPHQIFGFSVEVDIRDAAGSYQVFPYRLEHVQGKLVIDPHHVEIINAHAKRGDATVVVNGVVKFGPDTPLNPIINITARNVPIDRQLLDALQPDKRAWLEKLGLGGTIDVDGLVAGVDDSAPPLPSVTVKGARFQGWAVHPVDSAPIAPPPTAPQSTNPALTTTDPFGTPSHPPPPPLPVDFDLHMALRDGTVSPPGSGFTVTAVNGLLELTSKKLTLTNFTAKRADGDVAASGSVTWLDNRPLLEVSGSAHNVLLDTPLHDLLPIEARDGWDQVQPVGTVDGDLAYKGLIAPPGPANGSPRDAVATINDVPPTGDPAPTFHLVLHPRKLAATFKPLPYSLSELQGSVTIDPKQITLDNISGKHGEAGIGLAGTGVMNGAGGGQAWDLHVVGRNVRLNKELKHALPSSISDLIETIRATGTITFDLPHLTYSASSGTQAGAGGGPGAGVGAAVGTTPATAPASAFAPDANVDATGNLWLSKGSMNVGVPLDTVDGVIAIDTHVRSGKLVDFKGDVNIESMNIAGRPAQRFVATILKPADKQAMKVDRMGGQLCGGELGGQVDLAFPDEGASRYAMALVLRNVDVKELAQLSDNAMKGQLNASLALEGEWNVPRSRRGRGDVDVSGRDMYKIPLVLGLLQITNLSLPLSSPFSEGTARYSVEGPVITFENIDLRASNMVMNGSGSMNFETRKVQMTFVTDNPGWTQLPIVGGLIKGAKDEFLQIHVNGTIQDPKVTAGMMNTFTTTVDQVLKSNDNAAAKQQQQPRK